MAEIYNTDRFAELHAASQRPSPEALGLAAKHIAGIFQVNNIPAAFLGGWAVYLRGSGRLTNDLDIAVRDTMDHLIRLLSLQPGLSVPKRYGSTCVQIFVHTSPQPISVDVILGGNLGAPAHLPSGIDSIVPVPAEQGTETVQVLNIRHQLAAKLSAYFSRQATNDYTDLEYLIATYSDAVYECKDRLNLEYRQYFAEAYAAANANEPTWGDYIRQLLNVPQPTR